MPVGVGWDWIGDANYCDRGHPDPNAVHHLGPHNGPNGATAVGDVLDRLMPHGYGGQNLPCDLGGLDGPHRPASRMVYRHYMKDASHGQTDNLADLFG